MLEAKYELQVLASDEAVQSERRSSSVTVTVLGLAGEEAGPGFREAVYTADISEADPPGTFIATVQLDLVQQSPAPDFYITDVRWEKYFRNL